MTSMATLTGRQLDDLQAFLKDWLRHAGRTQADLRRALQATSIRMPVLLDSLQLTYSREGLSGLAQQLCAVEERWLQEDGSEAAARGSACADLGELDLLLEEIRAECHN
jgi:hypothetical protein